MKKKKNYLKIISINIPIESQSAKCFHDILHEKFAQKWHIILAKYDRKEDLKIFAKLEEDTSQYLFNQRWHHWITISEMFPLIFIQNILSIFFKHCAQIGQNICKISSKQDFKIFAKWETSNSFQSTHWITMFLLIRVYTKFWNLNFTLGKSWTLWLASAQKWYGKIIFKKYPASNMFSKIYCSQDIQDYLTSKTSLSMLLAKGG